MPFNSLPFLLFLPAVFLLAVACGEKARWGVLLAASAFFYAFKEPYLLAALACVSAATYAAGLGIGRGATPRARQAMLAAGIACNLAVLAVLKYLPPLWSAAGELLRLTSPGWEPAPAPLLASVGVSYYVFQAISYLADVYLEKVEAERHFGYLSLYLAFFPKLLQGPIERAGDLLPQLKKPYRFDYENARRGLVLFCWGLFKKLVIADRLAQLVGLAYGDVHGYAGISLLVATYCYALQIYCDFAGYTDMARGAALLFNIELTENFNSPYLATSVADFWRRWHISFSRWILDYIFTPLQMLWLRSVGAIGTVAALLVTFLASGLWHGATWGFVTWGALHGVYMGASVLFKPYRKKLYGFLGVRNGKVLKIWQTVVTFHLVSFAWIFFRASSWSDACFVSRSLFGVAAGDLRLASLSKLIGIFGRNDASIAVAATVVMLAAGSLRVRIPLFQSPLYLRWCCYLALVFMIVLLSSFHGSSEFIYVQF